MRGVQESGLVVWRDLWPAAGGDARAKLAKGVGVRGCFAVWRDGAVYEFGGRKALDAAPTELVIFEHMTGLKGEEARENAKEEMIVFVEKVKVRAFGVVGLLVPFY